MEIKRRTDYAIRMLLSIAQRNDNKPSSIKEISRRDEVPYQFARSIQYDLVQAGLLKTTRGARGGSMLARPADQISLLDIVEATQGPLMFSQCESDPEFCTRISCPVRNVWIDLAKDLRERLGAIRLNQLTGGVLPPFTKK